MDKMILYVTAAALALGPVPAQADVIDPAGDFLPTYTGPHNGDLDALDLSVILTDPSVALTSTVNGTIGTTAGSAFIWGVDRGSGTDRLISSGPPAVGPADLLFDAVIRLESGGGGRVVTFDALGTPTTTLLDPLAITISGTTISATIPFSLLPSTGFATEDYTYVFWTRSELGSQQFIADLAPDNASFAARAVPEPTTWGTMILGFGLLGAALRLSGRRRRGALA
jgi:hypothetical protein